jgi:hypothetical protein
MYAMQEEFSESSPNPNITKKKLHTSKKQGAKKSNYIWFSKNQELEKIKKKLE